MRQDHLAAIADDISKGRRCRLERLLLKIRENNNSLGYLNEVAERLAAMPLADPSSECRYVVSSLFLYDCFKKLTADPDEQFFFVTGAEIGGRLILDQPAEFEHDSRTMMGVTANVRSTHRVLIRLEQFGHRLLAHFHSHPGDGAGSTQPPGIDENFQRRLEAAGHKAVMAIFSRDGFVHFHRLDGIPKIKIFGSGVENMMRKSPFTVSPTSITLKGLDCSGCG